MSKKHCSTDDRACREYERDYWHRREGRVKAEEQVEGQLSLAGI